MEKLLELLHLPPAGTCAVLPSKDFLEEHLADININLNDTIAGEFGLRTLVPSNLWKNHSNVCPGPHA